MRRRLRGRKPRSGHRGCPLNGLRGSCPSFRALAFDVELVEEIRIEGYVEDGPETDGISFFAMAALRTDGSPLSLEDVYTAFPPAF